MQREEQSWKNKSNFKYRLNNKSGIRFLCRMAFFHFFSKYSSNATLIMLLRDRFSFLACFSACSFIFLSIVKVTLVLFSDTVAGKTIPPFLIILSLHHKYCNMMLTFCILCPILHHTHIINTSYEKGDNDG